MLLLLGSSGHRSIVAIVAIVAIVRHVLRDEAARFNDPGPGLRRLLCQPRAYERNHIRELEAFGDKVTLRRAA
jgi:hypothetical protein